MARYLALDWDLHQLHVVAATVTRRGVHIERAAAWDLEQSPGAAGPETLGRLLREKLKAAGIAPAPVLACVGRDRLILKDIRYPAVPAHEEPAIVRFQTAKDLTDAPDEVVIDYARLGGADGSGEQRALALVLRREVLVSYQNVCKSAGLKLLALAPRPFGMLAYLRDILAAEGTETTRAVLAVTQSWAELCIFRGERVLLARSLALGDALAGEVVRNIRVFGGQSPLSPVSAVYFAGGPEHEGLRQKLVALLSIPVHALDPLAGVAQVATAASGQAGFVGAVGLLHAWKGPADLPINFVRPKQPAPPRDPNRRRLALAAGVAAAVLLALVGFGYAKIAEKDRKLGDLYLEKEDLDRRLVQVEEDAKWIKALDDWDQSGIVWLDELYDLSDRFPDPSSIRLTGLVGDPLTRGGKDRHVAKMALKGMTTLDYGAINTLMSRLVEEVNYRVEPKQVGRNTLGLADRRQFPQQFSTRVDMEKRLPTQYLRQITGESPGRQRQGEGGPDFLEGLP